MGEVPYTAIIPAFNPSPMLYDAISSVLNQTLPPAEILIVDDGSVKPVVLTRDAHYKNIEIIRQENRGYGGALNTGIRAAAYNLLSFLDYDDLWAPTKTEKQLQLLTPGISAVGGRVAISDTRSPFALTREVPNCRVFGACLVKKSVFDSVGPVAEDDRTGEPFEWWSRFEARQRKVAFTDEIVLERRIHGMNLGVVRRSDTQRDLVARVREHRWGNPKT